MSRHVQMKSKRLEFKL